MLDEVVGWVACGEVLDTVVGLVAVDVVNMPPRGDVSVVVFPDGAVLQ